MKKKFLSLMMAAAVVATTSVSAFAAKNVQVTTPGSPNITGLDSESPTHKIDITGHVQNDKGEMPAANFRVTVPTAANFTVTKDSKVLGPELEVKNEGTQGIEVYATEFTKTSSGDLEVVKSSGLTGKPRTSVALRLVVNGTDVAYLGAGENADENGVFNSAELNGKTDGGEGEKLLTLEPGTNGAKTKTIELAGSAGTAKQPMNKAVSDTFKLVLKIKKAPVNSQ